MAALRDLVPVLGLAIKSAAQVEIARTLGRVYLGRETAEQVLRGRMQRGITEKIKAVLWYSDVRGSTAISERIGPDEIIPFLNDYAQASIDAIHDAGGEASRDPRASIVGALLAFSRLLIMGNHVVHASGPKQPRQLEQGASHQSSGPKGADFQQRSSAN